MYNFSVSTDNNYIIGDTILRLQFSGIKVMQENNSSAPHCPIVKTYRQHDAIVRT